jgi:hypothetical protein
MKSKSFLFALLTLVVFACADPEIKDPIVGDWKYTIKGPLQVGWTLKAPQDRDPILPSIVTTFTIMRSGAGYEVTNVKTMYGANEIATTATIQAGILGESLTSLRFEGPDFFVNMIDVRSFNEINHTAFANGVTFKNPGSASVYEFTGWALTGN